MSQPGERNSGRPMSKARLSELALNVRAMEGMLEVMLIANKMVERQEAANMPTAYATLIMEWAKAEPQMRAMARAIAEEMNLDRSDIGDG